MQNSCGHQLQLNAALPAPQDPFLKYQVGAPYEAMREFNGRIFGAAGRSIHHFLEWWHSSKVGPSCLCLAPC